MVNFDDQNVYVYIYEQNLTFVKKLMCMKIENLTITPIVEVNLKFCEFESRDDVFSQQTTPITTYVLMGWAILQVWKVSFFKVLMLES